MSHIPSLEPRGPQTRPNPALVGGATVVFLWGVLRIALSALDLFGKGEAAVDIYKLLPKLLQFLGHPAFSGVALVVGFAILIWQAKDFKPASPVQLVHPTTKLPVRSKPQIWPKIKRPVWTCAVAIAIAIPVWACYRTPLRNFVFVQPRPQNVIPVPTPPVIGPSAPEKNPPKRKTVPTAPPVKTLVPPQKPTIVPSQPIQAVPATPQNRQTNPILMPEDLPLTCPAPGILARGWKLYLPTTMGNGPQLPIEYGAISFNIDPDGAPLNPRLRQRMNVPGGAFKEPLLDESESLLAELKSYVGLPASPKTERLVSTVYHSFQNPSAITVSWADGVRGDNSAVQVGNVAVPITGLSEKSQEFIRKLDSKAKSGADEACSAAFKIVTEYQ
jgi:hypothetical protein